MSMAFSPDGRSVAVVALDKTAKIFSVETGALLKSLDWSNGKKEIFACSQEIWLIRPMA